MTLRLRLGMVSLSFVKNIKIIDTILIGVGAVATHRHKRSIFVCIFYVIFPTRLYNGFGKENAFVHKHCTKEYGKECSYCKNVRP